MIDTLPQVLRQCAKWLSDQALHLDSIDIEYRRDRWPHVQLSTYDSSGQTLARILDALTDINSVTITRASHVPDQILTCNASIDGVNVNLRVYGHAPSHTRTVDDVLALLPAVTA